MEIDFLCSKDWLCGSRASYSMAPGAGRDLVLQAAYNPGEKKNGGIPASNECESRSSMIRCERTEAKGYHRSYRLIATARARLEANIPYTSYIIRQISTIKRLRYR